MRLVMSERKPIRRENSREISDKSAESRTISDIRRTWIVSQGELAAIIGCRQSTVWRWEAGIHPMKHSSRRKLVHAARSRGLPWRPEWSQALGMVG